MAIQDNPVIQLLEGKIELNIKTCNSLKDVDIKRLTAIIGEKNVDDKLKELCSAGCGKACSSKANGNLKDLERGCKAKYPFGLACSVMAFTKKDKEDELSMKRKACKAYDIRSCTTDALIFEINKKYDLALEFYNIACDLGDSESCGTLGTIYATGEYVNRDNKKAYLYWDKSVKLNPNNLQSKDDLKILCNNNPSVCK